jgi:hypothetical protein
MKKTIILAISIVFINNIAVFGQSLQKADSVTSDVIFRKYFKERFLDGMFPFLSSNNPDSLLNNNDDTEIGDRFIYPTIPAWGDWALIPDYTVEECDLPLIWEGYKLYKITIPNSTPRNDSITRKYRLFRYRENISKRNPYCDLTWVAYNNSIENLKILSWLHGWSRNSDIKYFLNLQKQHKLLDVYRDCSEIDFPVLPPKTEYETEQMLRSELMKNIYSYRIMKAGILDSLRVKGYLKENIELFPLIDSLLPDIDMNLELQAKFIGTWNLHLTYWRFSYAGEDILYKANSAKKTSVENHAWDKYLKPIQRTYENNDFKITMRMDSNVTVLPNAGNFIVAYDTVMGIVHFVSGEGIFLTKFAGYYFNDGYYSNNNFREKMMFPKNTQDSIGAAQLRQYYVRDRMSAYTQKGGLSIDIFSSGEDDDYWYYSMKSETPRIYKVNDEAGEIKFSFYIKKSKYCTLKIRMSKKNYDIVEIIEQTDCFEGGQGRLDY